MMNKLKLVPIINMGRSVDASSVWYESSKHVPNSRSIELINEVKPYLMLSLQTNVPIAYM